AVGEAGSAPPRRADEPPRCGVCAVARAASEDLPRCRHRHHSRPVLPRPRRRMDRRGRSRPPLPLRGQLLDLPREEARTSAGAGQEGRQAGQAAEGRTRVGALEPKAKQTKSKARLARYEEMAAEAEKTRKLDFEEIQIPAGPRLGDVVIEADSLEKGFDGRQLIDGLSFSLPRNGIVGVIGPNGVGKSTLFKTIVGLEELDGGELKIGDSVKI